MSENLLDYIGYHSKWHGKVQNHREDYIYNQNDHLIQEIFSRLDIKSGTFVEFGAIDGIVGANTRLLYDNGWKKGVLIECDPEKYKVLERNYSNEDEIHTVNKLINTTDSKFDDIMSELNIGEIDFCSIDIDGLDLKIFKTVDTYLPKVVCIEGGQCLDPFEPEVAEEIAKNNIQQSLKSYCDVFNSKGYCLIASYQDNIFVKEEYAHLFDTNDKDILDFYIEGIIAYPRIPWLLRKCVENKVNNRILQFITSDMDTQNIYNVSFGSSQDKSDWVNSRYTEIVEKCKVILQNRENIV